MICTFKYYGLKDIYWPLIQITINFYQWIKFKTFLKLVNLKVLDILLAWSQIKLEVYVDTLL